MATDGLVAAPWSPDDARVTLDSVVLSYVNDTGTAVGFEGKRVDGPRLRMVDVDGGWIMAGATWFDGRAWHDHETPTCLRGAMPQPVEFGVVEAAASDDAPGRARQRVSGRDARSG